VRTLRVGESFADQGAKLVAIAHRRIVIERDGKLETVTIRDEDTGATGSALATAHPTPPLDVPGTPAHPHAGDTASSSGATLAMLETLLPGGSVDFVADVGVEAYRVSGARTTDALLTFQEDDRIRAINGVALSDPDLDLRVQVALRSGSELRLTVEDASGRVRAVPLPRQSVEQILRISR
jgi:type II secretory pathway component PulC